MSNRRRIGRLSYESCQAWLGGRDRVEVTYKTWVRRGRGGTCELVHHRTPILTFHADGRVIADCSGFRSSTTLSRLRECSGVDVYQFNHEWVIGPHRRPYHDGINLGVPQDWRERLEAAAHMGDWKAASLLKGLDKFYSGAAKAGDTEALRLALHAAAYTGDDAAALALQDLHIEEAEKKQSPWKEEEKGAAS